MEQANSRDSNINKEKKTVWGSMISLWSKKHKRAPYPRIWSVWFFFVRWGWTFSFATFPYCSGIIWLWLLCQANTSCSTTSSAIRCRLEPVPLIDQWLSNVVRHIPSNQDSFCSSFERIQRAMSWDILVISGVVKLQSSQISVENVFPFTLVPAVLRLPNLFRIYVVTCPSWNSILHEYRWLSKNQHVVLPFRGRGWQYTILVAERHT